MSATVAYEHLTPRVIHPTTLWEHTRNSLGIARLLSSERRCEHFIDTACRLAAECACRAMLDVAGQRFEGDVVRALMILDAPEELWFDFIHARCGAGRLAATERLVAWASTYLRHEVPDGAWGY